MFLFHFLFYYFIYYLFYPEDYTGQSVLTKTLKHILWNYSEPATEPRIERGTSCLIGKDITFDPGGRTNLPGYALQLAYSMFVV